MSSAIIFYYSVHGYSRSVAAVLSEVILADLYEIRISGIDGLEMSGYETVLIVTSIRVGNFSPALRSYFRNRAGGEWDSQYFGIVHGGGYWLTPLPTSPGKISWRRR